MTAEGDEGLGRLPVCVHVLESEGYVWDADGEWALVFL